MVDIRDLGGIPRETLHEAFLDAFSDYAVDMQMPLARFSGLLDRNGFDPAVSVGAFDGGALVGFLFSAQRMHQGRLTLYDCGTGVLPAYRSRRVGSMLLSAWRKRAGAERLLLEVLQDNAAAVALYERQGFRRLRELYCYRCAMGAFRADAVMPVTLTDTLPDVLLAQAQGSWSHAPTWQNSTASILRAQDEYAYAFVTDGALLLGYGVLHRASGSLAQIAVHPAFRRQRVGSSLVYALSTACQVSTLSAINADARDGALCAALGSWGFAEYARQYEMELVLR